MSHTKVFIGNLPEDASPSDIYDLMRHLKWSENEMKECDIVLVRDKDFDKFKGFAYVDVRTEERVKQFLTLNGSEFASKTLRVDRATPKEDHRKVFRGGSHGGGHRGGRGMENGRGGMERGRGGMNGGRDNIDKRGKGDNSRGSLHDKSDDRRNRGRKNSDRHHGEGQCKYDKDMPKATRNSERPRLVLAPKTILTPEELEQKKQREEEELKARQEKLFSVSVLQN